MPRSRDMAIFLLTTTTTTTTTRPITLPLAHARGVTNSGLIILCIILWMDHAYITCRSLTVFLSDGRELPTLHFHDGGSTGLLHALQRYIRYNNYIYFIHVQWSMCKTATSLLQPLSQGQTNKNSMQDFLMAKIYTV